MMKKGNLEIEAESFDNQIIERVKNGHIPDLRYTEKCDYFYNNPWRHPEYVKLDFVDQFELMNTSINECFVNRTSESIRILEVGCGPGYMSLEFAREGYSVTGIDISSSCIEIAKEFATKDPIKTERGRLSYLVCDLFELKPLENEKFDVVVFLGALHHFKEQQKVMDKVVELLNNNGIILAHEPTRDRVSIGNAAFYNIIKTLLSVNNGFYQKMEIPDNKRTLNNNILLEYNKSKYETEDGSKIQSVNDNEAGYKEMSEALSKYFDVLKMQDRYAYFHEIIGGLRFDEETNIKLARYLRDIDEFFCNNGVLNATEFYFVGRRKEHL